MRMHLNIEYVRNATRILHLKLVDASNHPQILDLNMLGAQAGMAKMYSLRTASYHATDFITGLGVIKPVESVVKITPKHTVPLHHSGSRYPSALASRNCTGSSSTTDNPGSVKIVARRTRG
jgi:hypothetical protein